MFEGSYCGVPPLPHDWATRWNDDPVSGLLLAAALLTCGALPAERRAFGLVGVGALVVTFVSPLCALSVALFSARAVHHLLIVGVAAPLLALALPRDARVGVPLALALSTLVLWAWHVPTLYDAALADKALYWIMQATLLGSAWVFWRAVMSASPATAAAGIAGGAAQMGMLGALLSFAPRPLYASHLTTTVPFGFGPLADQQLAGLSMWVIGLIPYAAAAGWLGVAGWRRLAPGAAA